ncbi:diacylglycerol kinase delta-like [Actinia tenebrosa]|uniref:Diacylglycerol kinase n=1 Tax=Actinia tenebrosa TaxID=6105 RepID=A0A6P8HPX7_ACTTE|nr:diacylglycerol kinase delta-like [Actinia tenebrosa]
MTSILEDKEAKSDGRLHNLSSPKRVFCNGVYPQSQMKKLKTMHCVKEGHLLKQSGSFQRWKKRYFKLREGKKLFYAKNNNQNTIFNEIDLQDVSVAETGIRNANNSFTVITPYRSLVLCAESRKEMDEWFGCLKALCNRRSTQSDILDQLTGTHNWYSCAHSRPTFCNVCKDILSGVTSKGLSCEVCRFKVHRRCAAKAPNNCKWTTIQSLKREELEFDESDPMSVPHQWQEGNLIPGSRCSVCDRQCGSKRRLQDFRCLWCNMTVHSACKPSAATKCTLGENALSILSPLCLEGPMGPGRLEAFKPTGLSPLLVFVNSKSGDNQGVKFIRKFKQLLNPIQVFDLGVGGPQQGIQIFKQFSRFRILVCGGDGSIGWVMKEVDNMNLTNKVQIGVLPLGTGNDLSRVLGWGTTFTDDSAVPQFLQHLERAKALMLDRWSIMTQECNPTLPPSRSSSIEGLDSPIPYQQEFDNMYMFENNVAAHLTRILHSSQHHTVISSAKVLCETVKDFVSKVGAASASSDPEEAKEPGSLAQKCEILNEKLNLLLKALSIESEASPPPAKEEISDLSENNSVNNNGKTQKVFVPREALMSRANSLKKALKQIIQHTETAVDEQNARTSPSTSSLAKAIVEGATAAADEVVTTSSSAPVLESVLESTADQELESELPSYLDVNPIDKLLSEPDNDVAVDMQASNNLSAAPVSRSDARFLSRGSSYPYQYEPSFDDLLAKQSSSKSTVQFNSCIISKAFLKDRPKDSIVGSLIGKALLANADALCAAATPMMNTISDVDGYNEKCTMNNYFGIGIDAKICLDFHNRREEHPEKYRSRKKNMIWYGFLGGKEFVQRTYKNLDQRVKLECDGNRISLPSLQGIVVLNITSYMGGANFWGGSRDDGFTQPSFDDSFLEVIAVLGAQQMGISKVFGGMQHHRIAQCRVVKITITGEPIPVQVDGEAWMQTPGYIKIVQKNRAQMLVRDRAFENTLKLWTDIQQEKNALINDFENETLKSLAVAITPLIQSVREASKYSPELEEDLFEWSTMIERLLPDNKSQENLSRTRAVDFLSNAKAFTQEVIWFLNEKLQSLVPPLREDKLTSITTALNAVEPELLRAVDVCGLPDLDDERDKATNSKGKSKFSFGLLRSKKPEMTKAVTAPAGRMIQYWGVEEVGRWLENIGLVEYRDLFARNDICGNELLNLTRPDLKDLGVTKVGHIKRILHGIKQLCGGLSPRSAAKIERTSKCEEKPSRSTYLDKEYSH